MINYTSLLVLIMFLGCSSEVTEIEMPPEMEEEEKIPAKADQAVVSGITITGNEGAYTFNVELTSPDTGCEQYADWWEVIDADGNLIHRRVLGHSHVDEQPFVRSGSPVDVATDEFIYVRGHMNTNGYGTIVYAGTIADGLKADVLQEDFAIELADADPQPSTCAF